MKTKQLNDLYQRMKLYIIHKGTYGLIDGMDAFTVKGDIFHYSWIDSDIIVIYHPKKNLLTFYDEDTAIDFFVKSVGKKACDIILMDLEKFDKGFKESRDFLIKRKKSQSNKIKKRK